MTSAPRSSKPLVAYDHLHGLLNLLGLPPTKANAIVALYHPDVPTFPLDPEIVAEIPQSMPGRMPRNLTDLFGAA
jgi:hypothetical protein